MENASALILGLIGLFFIGFIRDILGMSVVKNKEGLSMKTKIMKILAAFTKTVLSTVWSIGTNFMAGALLA